MKKLIASILALSVISAIFCSCGNDAPSSSEDNVSLSSEESSAIEDVTEKITEESSGIIETSESKAEPSAAALTNDDYKAALTEVYKAFESRDVDRILQLSVPESTYNSMKSIGFNKTIEDELDNLFDTETNIDSVEVLSVETAELEDLKSIEKAYSFYDGIFSIMADAGITYAMLSGEEDIPEEKIQLMEKLTDKFEDINDLENIDVTVEFETYAHVTYSINDEEVTMPVFNTAGEELKIDSIIAPSMIGYVRKSKQQAANANAKTISIAANAALVDLDEENVRLEGVNIISSDSRKNVLNGISEDVLEKILERMEYFYDDLSEKDFFLVINNGMCVYTAVAEKDNTGTYPVDSIFTGDTVEQVDTLPEFDELYETVLNNVSKK